LALATILEVKHLKKYFPLTRGLLAKRMGWIRAVDDISFSIEEGKTFALVGESGCGKTTTAKTILLLEGPTTGSISFRGKEISKLEGTDLREYKSSVQAVFQDPFASLSPRMRVGSIVAEPLEVNTDLDKTARQRRVGEVLAQVGLDHRAVDLFPHEFSGGQRQRIAVARSLSVNPSLIILDEPVSALDVSIRAQIMNLLKDLQDDLGITYLLIAHNLATLRYLSHHVGVMYLGRIVEQGPVEQVFTKRLHPYTKALFSAALASHPDSVDEEIILSGEVPSPINPPIGCRFHTRCPTAKAICSEDEPELKEIEPGHYVSCHLD
jgi:peptide/nickel transport system ATP-binding protein/oligopeptide transport system ATP-binding protein